MFIKKQDKANQDNQEMIKKPNLNLRKIALYSIGVIFFVNVAFFSLAAPIIAQKDQTNNNGEGIASNIVSLFKGNKKEVTQAKEVVQEPKVIKKKSTNITSVKSGDTAKTNNVVSLVKESVNSVKSDTDVKVVSYGYHTITAYNSLPEQTDDSPCITANNFNVCEHGIEDTVAANFLKFNTKVRIPELFGDRVFIVRDRMNRRYPEGMDVWMKDYGEARKLGRRLARVEVIVE